jgi:hypothetical protein
LRRCLTLGLVSLLALAACSSSGGNEDLKQRVEELEQQLAEATSTTGTTSTTSTATTTIAATTSHVKADSASAESWNTRFPGFERLFDVEVSKDAEAWCRARPEEVLASFSGIYAVNDFERHWQLAMSMLEGFDYDVDAWRQDDKYDNGFWAWRSACESAHRLANAPPITVDPLLTIEVSQAAALWCSTRPDEVLAAFAALHEANNTGDLINDPWTSAGLVLSQVDYDVDAWRNLDKFEVGFWAWRASCQVAYDSR